MTLTVQNPVASFNGAGGRGSNALTPSQRSNVPLSDTLHPKIGSMYDRSDSDSRNRDEERTTEMAQSFYKPIRDVHIEDYPDENTFVYKSHRKNIMLVRPGIRDSFKAGDSKNRVGNSLESTP